MKKLFSLMLLLATMLTFTACSGDDEPENGISKSDLIGLWDATAVQFNNDGKWIDITNRPDLALSISFYEDGSYYGEGALGDGEGTYTLSGNTIKTYIDGELYGTYVVKSLIGDQAELTLTMEGETIGIRAKKSKINLAPNDESVVIVIKNGNTTRLGSWENKTLEGSHFVLQWFTFDRMRCLHWRTDDYTIDDKGMHVVNINGDNVRATLNSQTFKDLSYSYDGKTLVTRDDIIVHTEYGKLYPSYEEHVYSATVTGDKLTVSDDNMTTVYIKES
ncbi:MAG: hypothetical protein Q4F07_08590 [Bacteroidales bacterium]|nr:hypothetical protein [Bacteroidales bacterium]